MKVLVVGATGATGRLLVKELLDRGCEVKIVVRSKNKLEERLLDNNNLTVIEASILNLNREELEECTKGCDVIASCLGHNLTWKGIYGKPRMLVTEAAKRLSKASKAVNRDKRVKYILMNTTGNKNRDLKERISIGDRIIISIIRLLLPPQRDNEKAADFFRLEIPKGDREIEWACVRPDGLINSETVSDYDIYESPIRSAIFNPGKTSRINVANFMAELICNSELWSRWKGRMPVIYNREI